MTIRTAWLFRFARNFLRGRALALLQEWNKATIAKFTERIEEENAGQREQDEAHEQAIHGSNRASDDDPHDPRNRDQAKHNGNQQHHGKQATFPPPSSILATCPGRTQLWLRRLRQVGRPIA